MRQYIGARYVPLFMGDWNPTLTYAPLSIVMYGNASYTSKIPVPAGTLPTDTKYWYMSGNYNGQIQALDQKIGLLNTKVDSSTQNLQSQITTQTENIAAINTEVNNLLYRFDDYAFQHTLFMFSNKSLSGHCGPNELYVEYGSIHSHTWQNAWESWDSPIKAQIKNIVILGGQYESVATTQDDMNSMVFGDCDVTYIWIDDVWHLSARSSMYSALRRIEYLTMYGRMRFENLFGFIHSPEYYQTTGYPAQNYYDFMVLQIFNYLKGNQFLTVQYNPLNIEGVCVIDGHMVQFINNQLTISVSNWVNGSITDLPFQCYFNPGSFSGSIIGYVNGNIPIFCTFPDHMEIFVKQMGGEALSGQQTIVFPNITSSMHLF